MADQKISELNEKTTPANSDLMAVVDIAAAPDETKKVTWANIKATLKTYFDTVYSALGHTHAQLHDRLHSITSTSDHSSSATPGQMLKADANGLPVDGSNTDAEVADAVSKKHAQGTDTALGAVGTKNPPIDADKALYRDSASSDALVTSTWTQIKAFLKTYFDTIYAALVHKTRHENGGADEINVGGLSGLLADDQHVLDSEAVTAVEAAGLALASGKNVKFISALTLDHTWSGNTAVLTAGEDLAIGDAVYIKSDGKAWKADADASSTMPITAIATATISADATGEFLLLGFMRDNTWDWTAGGLLYGHTTAGNLTQTAPSGSGDQVQVVGVAITADIILFNPSYELVEIS